MTMSGNDIFNDNLDSFFEYLDAMSPDELKTYFNKEVELLNDSWVDLEYVPPKIEIYGDYLPMSLYSLEATSDSNGGTSNFSSEQEQLNKVAA